MKIHQSAEDYLEKILMIRERKGEVHSIDIANELGFSKPSVSVAMKNLRQAGYISMDGNGAITLEPPGYEIASRIYQRHKLLTRILAALGVDEETAAQDACKIEHDLSPETFEKLRAYAEAHLPPE
ncbi:MAG TPA: metal-dependent transcriptional regulator [Candidatus Gemmiger avicola]|uniref:Metal-dependent transcriptional regulator n=1 Tax=Candidatus Gemmiger avicola TaxID=2838605 RepID=A0A9D2S3I3_9FIRM|nr:metal-dependent transcriptional regulator [Candidatus Gemmiger avicola]